MELNILMTLNDEPFEYLDVTKLPGSSIYLYMLSNICKYTLIILFLSLMFI